MHLEVVGAATQNIPCQFGVAHVPSVSGFHWSCGALQLGAIPITVQSEMWLPIMKKGGCVQFLAGDMHVNSVA